ncbi:hypothetical protein TREES_T100005254 [Tupaia chinensis]|uniref:Uncharacterized protein n=1 Tax=Tupaia chinensis TaxID=246437 RepID=L9KZ43_TUPCH|nr:hypothetical protein TREES_T100005254 [Tupaia chinensis]
MCTSLLLVYSSLGGQKERPPQQQQQQQQQTPEQALVLEPLISSSCWMSDSEASGLATKSCPCGRKPDGAGTSLSIPPIGNPRVRRSRCSGSRALL